jgi:hypothetical protein
MKKEVQENFERLARHIWKRGELKNREGCLVPSGYTWNQNPDRLFDDPIIDEYRVTHYDRQWEELGKYVRINIYEAEAFGAAEITGEPKKSFIVEV